MNINREWQSGEWREKYRVRITFIFAVFFVWRAQPRYLYLLVLGFIISFFGILLRQWSAGCVKKMDALATSGPYALVRHPLYVGSFLIAVGLILSASTFSFSLSKPNLDRTLFFWCFFWLLLDSIYSPKIQKEEKILGEKFSSAYEEYRKKVPPLVPRVLNLAHLDFSSFRWELWVRNREYYSIIGYLLVCFILVERYLHR